LIVFTCTSSTIDEYDMYGEMFLNIWWLELYAYV
jgi:hypothetical protein